MAPTKELQAPVKSMEAVVLQDNLEESGFIGCGSPWAEVAAVFRAAEEELEKATARSRSCYPPGNLRVLHRWRMSEADLISIALN